jgi:hypothetical protein
MRKYIRFFVVAGAKLLLQIKVFRDIYEEWLENIQSAHRQDIKNIQSAHRQDIKNIQSAYSLSYPPEIESIYKNSGNKISIVYKKNSDLLAGLFERHGSDKGYIQLNNLPYPWIPHNYSDFYSRLFGYRRESITKVFECGIGTNDISFPSNMTSNGKPGASLRAWRDYFPNAFVYGADIDRNVLFEEERIKTFYVDQLNPQSIESCWDEVGENEFDVILDDGLHTFEAGVTLFVNSIERLSATGTYIIEDVSLPDLLRYEAYFQNTTYKVEYVSLNDRNRSQLGDNSLVVIEKH